MDLAIDASALIAVIANEPEKDALVELTEGARLLAPPSVNWEIGNALSAMLKRNRISVDQATHALAVYHQIPIRFADVELEDSIRIAAEHNIYAYDAYLLRCAVKYVVPLISLDKNLLALARNIGIKVIEVPK